MIQVPLLTKLPGAHHHIVELPYEESPVPVIDLRGAIGFPPPRGEVEENPIIEHNRTVQGFLVGHVRNIVNTTWTEIQPPPKSAGRANY